MDEFTPFLQIVHISDLHVTDPTSPTAVRVRESIRKLRHYVVPPLRNLIVPMIEEGVAPHDRLAAILFREFLLTITSSESGWSECKTWIVDTGDLTSLGDRDSLALGREFLDDLAKLGHDLASIYGNHDAWPGKLPIWADKAEIEAQAKALAAMKYIVAIPGLALKMAGPHGGEVQLYFVDSVSHSRWRNLWARGEVSDPQLKELELLVDQNHQSGRKDFRILAVHHPVHYPPPRPATQMSMRNDSKVASKLDTPSKGGAYPLAHLVLSGHTHQLFPEYGKLPSQPSLCLHPYLGNDQCQFVVGTLMQLDSYNKRDHWPHQCEVLRLYYSRSNPSILLLQRLLAARQGGIDYPGTGIGPYQFVRPPDGTGETITFDL